jgi:hypothetical protein
LRYAFSRLNIRAHAMRVPLAYSTRPRSTCARRLLSTEMNRLLPWRRTAAWLFVGVLGLALFAKWAMPSGDDREFDAAFAKMVGVAPFDSPAVMKQVFSECEKFDIPKAWDFPGRFPSYECVLHSEAAHTLFLSRDREIGVSRMSLSPSPRKCVSVRYFKRNASSRWHVESPDITDSAPDQSQQAKRWHTWDDEDGSYGYSAAILLEGGRPALLGVEAYLGCVIQATLSLL